MHKVRGIGGVFIKAQDKDKLVAWYREHLGIDAESWGGVSFSWHDGAPEGRGTTVWSTFAADSAYFEPTNVPYMINYRVDDLDGMLAQLRDAGVDVDDRIEESEFGRFGWARDCEGNRFELWQPPEGM